MIGRIAAGAERAGRKLADLDLQVGAAFEVDDDVARLIDKYRPRAAFTLGAMGSAKTNFYNAAYRRAGWSDVAEQVQSLWVGGDKEAATRAVPDEFVLACYFIGTEAMVADRVRAHARAGITTLRIEPTGPTLADRIANLEQSIDVIRSATRPGV